MPIKKNPDIITQTISKHPFIITAAFVLLILIATGMQLQDNIASCALMLIGYAVVIGYGIYLKKTQRLTNEALIVLVFVLGFVLRLGYVLYTDITVRQNDVFSFTEGEYNLYHSGYILYVRDTFSIPDADVRLLGQFYHPPFHYYVCAVFLRAYELFLPDGTHNYDALQALSFLWTQYAVLMLYKCIKRLGIRKEDYLVTAAVISAFPTFTLLSGSVNNDILSILLFFTAFFFGLKWYQDGGWKNIILSSLATGFGMMTKLSIGLIAFPLGFLFIVKLIKDLHNKEVRTVSVLNLAAFGAISVPLGLWFQIRNYLLYGVPVTYVLKSDNIYQDISRFSPAQRLFGFYNLPIVDYYINLGSDGNQDYNIFITQVKTALFGEENYRDDLLMSMAGYALLIVFLFMILIAAAGLVRVVIMLIKTRRSWEDLSMIILAAAELISIITFSLKYPHICSMNFRYATPLVLCGAVFYCRIHDIKLKGENKDLIAKITKLTAMAFLVLSIVFYTVLWTYVKGEVTVADVTW